jgi:glucosylglycerol-phosphate synthase
MGTLDLRPRSTPCPASLDSRRRARSPNGIIPSLKGFFRHFENGLWLAWQKVPDEQLGQLGPRDTLHAGGHGYDLQSVGLTAELVESFYHRTSKSAL